jgi:hypothetical protein
MIFISWMNCLNAFVPASLSRVKIDEHYLRPSSTFLDTATTLLQVLVMPWLPTPIIAFDNHDNDSHRLREQIPHHFVPTLHIPSFFLFRRAGAHFKHEITLFVHI